MGQLVSNHIITAYIFSSRLNCTPVSYTVVGDEASFYLNWEGFTNKTGKFTNETEYI